MKSASRLTKTIVGLLLGVSFAAMMMVALDDAVGAGCGLAIGAGVWVALFSDSSRHCRPAEKSTPRHD